MPRENKKSYTKWIVIGVIAVIALGSFGWWTSTYNTLVAAEEEVVASWAQVENVYERKYKLIPNIVKTADKYADFEKGVLTDVTEARSNAASIKIDAENLNPEMMAKFEKAQSALSGSMSRLLATFERYPDLKANQNYAKLIDELEGSENRITVERRKYNEAVKIYNTKRRGFFRSMVADHYEFEKKELFEASEEAVKNDLDVNNL